MIDSPAGWPQSGQPGAHALVSRRIRTTTEYQCVLREIQWGLVEKFEVFDYFRRLTHPAHAHAHARFVGIRSAPHLAADRESDG